MDGVRLQPDRKLSILEYDRANRIQPCGPAAVDAKLNSPDIVIERTAATVRGLSNEDIQLAIGRFKSRHDFGVRARSSLEDFLAGYTAGLRAQHGVDARPAERLFQESTPDAWRLTLDSLGVAAGDRAQIVGAFRARAETGGRARGSFNDFVAAYLVGRADAGSIRAERPLANMPDVSLDGAILEESQQSDDDQPLAMSPQWLNNLPDAYIQWNCALAEEFFGLDLENRPAYLAVDGDRLAQIAEKHGWPVATAEDDFVASTRVLIQPRSQEYAKPLRFMNNDSRMRYIPPFIGVLGLTVLAASHMASDARMSTNNYFGRYTELLGSAAYGRIGFEHVVAAWERLNDWLNKTHHGRLGRATARPLGRLNWVGFPISQSLMRDQDRRRLPAFFRWASLLPGDAPPVADLIPLLIEWSNSPSARLTHFGRRSLQDAGSKALVAEIAAYELEQWSGELETEDDGDRRRTARLWLGLEDHSGRRVSLCLIPQRPSGFPPALALQSKAAGSLALHVLSEDDPWYEPLQVMGSPLETGRTEWMSEDRRFAVRLEPVEVAALVPDDDLGCWRQVPRLRFDEEALVLASADRVAAVEDILRDRALAGWEANVLPGLPGGWTAFTDVRIIRAGDTGTADLRCLSPLAAVGISLAGGLALGRGTWLSEGEPTVHIRSALGASPLPLLVDGSTVAMLAPEGGAFDLSTCSIPPGTHVVQAGDQRVTFSTRPGSDPPGIRLSCSPVTVPLRRTGMTYSPAIEERRDVWLAGPPGIVRIRGAEVLGLPEDELPGLWEPVSLAPCSKRFYVLGRVPGQVVKVDGHFHSQWPIAAWDHCLAQTILPPFRPQWLVRQSRGGKWNIQALPDLTTVDTEAARQLETADEWARLLLRMDGKSLEPEARLVLQDYQRAATSMEVGTS